MPMQAYNFTIYLEYPEDGANASFYLEGKLVGKADENGKVVFNIDDLELGKKYNVTIKKEGYRDKIIEVYNAGCDNGIRSAYSNYRIQPEPTVTPEPTPELFPTAPPLPEGHKSTKERLQELENTTAEHETRITWLEGKIKAILDWIKDKFGDIL